MSAEPICSPLSLPCSWHVHSTTVRTVVAITTHRSTRRHCAIFSLAPTGSEGCGKTTPASALINCLAHYLLATVWLPRRRTLPARSYVTMYFNRHMHTAPSPPSETTQQCTNLHRIFGPYARSVAVMLQKHTHVHSCAHCSLHVYLVETTCKWLQLTGQKIAIFIASRL